MKCIGNLTGSQSRRALNTLLCLVAVAGVISGAVYGASHNAAENVLLSQNYLAFLKGRGALCIIRDTFIVSVAYIAVAYLAGLFAFGQPLGAVLMIYRGFGAGASSAMLYSTYGTAAVTKVFVMLLPYSMAVIAVSVVTVRELMRASGSVLRIWVTGENRNEKVIDLRLYSLKFAVLLIISLILSLAEGALYLVYNAVG